jgi:hypothetical protein
MAVVLESTATEFPSDNPETLRTPRNDRMGAR